MDLDEFGLCENKVSQVRGDCCFVCVVTLFI